MGCLILAFWDRLRVAQSCRATQWFFGWPVLLLLPTPAFATALSGVSPDIFLVVAALSLALAMTVWALTEHRGALALRRALRGSADKARAMISARDAWLSAGRESLLVWIPGGAEPISFGNGATLFQDCMSGPDSAALDAGLKGLTTDATGFTLSCRSADRRTIAVRGRRAGGGLTGHFSKSRPRPANRSPTAAR